MSLLPQVSFEQASAARLERRALAVTVELFGELTARQHRELTEQAERLGEFYGCMVGLTLAPVAVRSHL